MKSFPIYPLFAAWLLGSMPAYLNAQPGSGIRVGRQTLLVPSVSASYSYDDNVNLRKRALAESADDLNEEDSDSFLKVNTKLQLTHWNASTRISGSTWFNTQRYRERSELDDDTYGADATVFWSRPNGNTTVKVQGSYQRAIDRSELSDDFVADLEQSPELENVGERVERDETRAHVELSQKLITDLRTVVTYGYANYEYNLERYNDRSTHTPGLELNYQWTAKTQPYLKAGSSYTEDDGFDDTAENPFYLAGFRYAPTPKLDFDLAAGYESYTRTPNEGVDEGEELENSGVKWTARVNYAVTRKLRASLSGRTGYGSVASAGGSSREEISASFALNHRLTDQISQRASVSWREDDYLSRFPARGTTFDETKETLYYQYHIDYQTVRPWLSLFAQIGYEDGSSNIPGDSYTQAEFRLGATARY